MCVVMLCWVTILQSFRCTLQSPQNNLASPLHLKNQSKGNEVDPSTTIFVVSMQGTPGIHKANEGRLDAFKEKWRGACGPTPVNIEHCHGVVDTRRGYGVTTSFLFCLDKAKEYDLDMTIIFEDDARLFERATSFCDVAKRKGEYWKNLPKDTFICFLGGHNWMYEDGSESGTITKDVNKQYNQVKSSYGSYGFAVPRNSFDQLVTTLKEDIMFGYQEKGVYLHHDLLSPEDSWRRAAFRLGKKIYAVNPLVVWHEAGYSNTWGRERESITGEEIGESQGIRGVGK